MMTRNEIEQILRDYHWMVREIERIRGYLAGAGERTVREYGIESGMPKPKGRTSDPVHQEVARREKQWKRVEKLEDKVRFVQERIELISDERERTVLDCMLDGMSFTAIAYHMRLSKGHVNNIKDSIVNRLFNSQRETA
jgi:Response regulator containing a CheY-like receiver domain and an HTH DNA-binding domain